MVYLETAEEVLDLVVLPIEQDKKVWLRLLGGGQVGLEHSYR